MGQSLEPRLTISLARETEGKGKAMEFVKYVGTAHRRVISADDFRRAGFPDQGSVEWSPLNGFSVPVDSFAEGVLDGVIHPDRSLIIVSDYVMPLSSTLRQTPAQHAGQGQVDMSGAVGARNAPAAVSGAAKATRRPSIPAPPVVS